MKIKRGRIESVFNKSSGKKIIVVGDYMLDVYLWGSVDRISPEAPVPVVNGKKTTRMPGGAANVVQNLFKLKVAPVPVGVVGNDSNGKYLIDLFRKKGIDVSGIVMDPDRPTTTKTRIIAHNQQVARTDEEDVSNISRKVESELLARINAVAEKADGVIIEDYNKGVITSRLMKGCIKTFNKNKVFVAVDPKQKNLHYFKGVSLIKPNIKEAAQMVNSNLKNKDEILAAAKKILKQYKLQGVLITLGEDGMALYESNNDFTVFPSAARKVFDVTGAGDTVISSLVTFVAAGASFKEASYLANQAAGIVVGEVGTATIGMNALRAEVLSAEK